MFKNIMNNTQFGVGKSIYNLESNVNISNNNTTDLANFIDSLASPQIQPPTTITNPVETFNNITAATITTNILNVLDHFYMGEDKLLQISPSELTTLNGAPRQDVIVTTNNNDSSVLSYVSILLNVPYLYSEPDYVPNSNLFEAPDNYLEIYDSKFKVSGPFTEIESRKTSITTPIITLGYIDRVNYDSTVSTIRTPTPYDKGIAFEYIDLGGIATGFYGYSTQYDRFVFYKASTNNGTATYTIYKNGINTGTTGIYTDYNVTRYDNTSLTTVEADELYTHVINSSDQIYTSSTSGILDRSFKINSYGKFTINVNQDTNLTPGNFDFIINVKANIIESSSTFSGNYTNDYTILCNNSYFGTTSINLTSFNINASSINFTSYDSSSTSIDIKTNSVSGGIKIASGTNGTNVITTGNLNLQSGTLKQITLTAGSNGLTETSTGHVIIQSTSSNINISTGSNGNITNTSGTGGIINSTTGNIEFTSGSSQQIIMTSGTSGFFMLSSGNIIITSGTSNQMIITAGSGGLTETSAGQITIQSTSSNIALSTGLLGSINNTSGTGGITNTTTGNINIYTTGVESTSNINTLNIGNSVNIGNTSTIKLDSYAQVTNYLSIGSISRNINTILEITTNLLSTGASSAILITPTINGYNNNSVQSFNSNPTIITQPNNVIPLVTNMSLYPVNLTIGSSGSVENSSTLYIDGSTTTGNSNYSIYSKIGNIFFGGSISNILFDSTSNLFELNDVKLEIQQNIGNLNPYLSIINSSQKLNYYLISATNLIGSGELYLDGVSTHIKMQDNCMYSAIGTISAVQFDGTACQFQIMFNIIVIGGVQIIKASNIVINFNDKNNFSYTLTTNNMNDIIFNVKSLNNAQTNWNGNIAVTTNKI